ncbi:MAG: pimeloyl-CoA dehydrogenase small subunit [Alphaproteobacteria bacterium]|nr:pimeloyl-CoA dehydrogenase small subunit [Alphaproteobacteria bacterium]
MAIALSEEQRLLQESARRFVERDYGFATRSRIVASEDGIDGEKWRQFAELGWLGVAVPEAYGGMDGGLAEIAVLLDAVGRGLVVEPLLSTIVLGGGLIGELGTEAQKRDLLPPMVAGERRFAVALGEPQARYDLHDVTARARPEGDGFVISGHKSVVYDAPGADMLLVVARSAGEPRDVDGLSLFLVAPGMPGVTLRPYPTIDGGRGADVVLDDVRVSGDAILGTPGSALAALTRAVDRARIVLGSEAAGIMAVLVDATRDYLKTRRQFGTTLEKFQVLQHRLVDMLIAQQMTEALVLRVALEYDDLDNSEKARAAAAVKAKVGEAGKFIGQQAVQLHGGIGMTDELPVGHYFKRLSIIGTMFGDAAYHLRRFRDLA